MTQLPNIALVGRMGSGKSTVAEMLGRYGYVRHSWAAPVRTIFAMAYDGDLTGAGYLETKTRMYTVVDPDGNEVERSGRELLQRIGTDALRDNVDKDFWLKVGLKSLRGDVPYVNDDTRFINEANALAHYGFIIVRITRPGTSVSDHPSETEQERIFADVTIENNGSLSDLENEVAALVGYAVPGVDFPLERVDHPLTVKEVQAHIEKTLRPALGGWVEEPWGTGDGTVYGMEGSEWRSYGAPNTGGPSCFCVGAPYGGHSETCRFREARPFA